VLESICSLDESDSPLTLKELPVPKPENGEVLLRVKVCGVCHTELDEIEGRTPPTSFPVVLGHEVIGEVVELGIGATKWKVGDRVGVGWINCSSGEIDENLSKEFVATGRDVNGGYAEYMKVRENYAYSIPECFSNEEAAPLLCAGGVGYRALKLSGLEDGGCLGLMGFGGSAHIVLQAAKFLYPDSEIYVFARHGATHDFARKLGANWVGTVEETPPRQPDAIIDTTPAWKPIVEALRHLKPGGRLVINAIRKEDKDKDYLLKLSYEEHLWLEKEIKSVANVTHFDLEEFLPLAAKIPIRPVVQTYALEQANEALVSLKRGEVEGAKVLQVS